MLSQSVPYSLQGVLLDLRGHGKSPAFPEDNNTIETAAQDVVEFTRHKCMSPDVLIGHSLGGKVALELLKHLKPKQAWILDSVPGHVDIDDASVKRVLDAVEGLKLPISSRENLIDHLTKHLGFSVQLAHWLASNLVMKGKHEHHWAFDIKTCQDLFHSYSTTDYWNILSSPPGNTQIHLVKAMQSSRWQDEDMQNRLMHAQRTSKGQFFVHEIDAGHWLHAEKPRDLVNLMVPHLCTL